MTSAANCWFTKIVQHILKQNKEKYNVSSDTFEMNIPGHNRYGKNPS